MELIFCAACNRAVLERDDTCPHCFQKNPHIGTSKGLGILTSVMLGLGVTACDPKPSTEGSIAVETQTTTTTQTTVVAKKTETETVTRPTKEEMNPNIEEEQETRTATAFHTQKPTATMQTKYGRPPVYRPGEYKDIGTATVTTTIVTASSKEQIKVHLKSKERRIVSRYKRILRDKPSYKTVATVRFVIVDRKATKIRIHMDRNNTNLKRAIRSAVASIEFDSELKGSVGVTYSFQSE